MATEEMVPLVAKFNMAITHRLAENEIVEVRLNSSHGRLYMYLRQTSFSYPGIGANDESKCLP
jgi:hypothetical protein